MCARKLKRALRSGHLDGRKGVVAIGVDPSPRGLAVAILRWRGSQPPTAHAVWCWTEKPTLQKRHADRLCLIRMPKGATLGDGQRRIEVMADWFDAIVRKAQVKWMGHALACAIEGYAFNMRGRSISVLHELGGALRQVVWRARVPLRVYTPTTVKLAATGSGSADKGDMKVSAWQRYKLDFTKYGSCGENMADAVHVAALLGDEMRAKRGLAIDRLHPITREVLTRPTKKEPVPLVRQPLAMRDDGESQVVVKLCDKWP